MADKQYDNTNRFVLFSNDGPKADDRDADFSGSINVDGKEYFIDGWKKTSNKGQLMLSGRIKQKRNNSGSPKKQQEEDDDF